MFLLVLLISVIFLLPSPAKFQIQSSTVQSTGPPVPVNNAEHKFGDKNEVHDKEHLKVHLENTIDIDKGNWTEDKAMFHYFSMHDLNKDAVIDGLEIMKAITHDHSADDPSKPKQILSDETLENLVDGVLKDIDANGDGAIDYSEYVSKQILVKDKTPQSK